MPDYISRTAWLFAAISIVIAGFIGWSKRVNVDLIDHIAEPEPTDLPIESAFQKSQEPVKTLSFFTAPAIVDSIPRYVKLNTNLPQRSRNTILEYTVNPGDSIFSISQQHNIKPETILWSNYDVLKDNPHSLSIGMILKIPPVDGIYYQWQDGDSFDIVASEFGVDVRDIIIYSGNKFDLTNPVIKPEDWIMIPGGKREFQQWIVPVFPRGAAGVSSGLYGGGVCPGGYEGLYGSGAFIWPTINRTISGNDYWSGHLAIDIGAAPGESIMASDSGVIVFSGWASGGYGFTVAIDHGNGYQTLYAHLSSIVVNCGQSVVQGQTIGYGGSTGNSTGPHLHFEIRYQGGFVNPWYVLPAP